MRGDNEHGNVEHGGDKAMRKRTYNGNDKNEELRKKAGDVEKNRRELELELRNEEVEKQRSAMERECELEKLENDYQIGRKKHTDENELAKLDAEYADRHNLWICPHCETMNSIASSRCAACGMVHGKRGDSFAM